MHVDLVGECCECRVVQVVCIGFFCSVPCFQKKVLEDTGGLTDRLDFTFCGSSVSFFFLLLRVIGSLLTRDVLSSEVLEEMLLRYSWS